MTKKKRKRIGRITGERKPPIPLPKRTKTKREKLDASDKRGKERGWND